MLYIVIGQSGAGKTSYVKDRWAQGQGVIQMTPIPHTLYDDGKTILLGKYGIGIRTEGTDTLPYTILPKALQFINSMHRQADIIVEGDRINSTKFFDFVIAHRIPAKLILLTCTESESITRLRVAGSKITPKFVKGTKTKSRNHYMKYRGRMSGEVISTSSRGSDPRPPAASTRGPTA